MDNSDYYILLPVTNSPEWLHHTLQQIPDLSRLIIVNNFDNPKIYEMATDVRDRGAIYHYHPENLGLAASWNLGLKTMNADPKAKFVVFLSVSAEFRPGQLQQFIDNIRKHENASPTHRYLATAKATLHCFAHTQNGLDLMGQWDENFYPIYMEDTDMCYRTKLLRERGEEVRVKIFNRPIDGVVSREYSHAVNSNTRLFKQMEANMVRMGNYYHRKWGEGPGVELWKHPFNNPEWALSRWELEGPFYGLPPRPESEPWNR